MEVAAALSSSSMNFTGAKPSGLSTKRGLKYKLFIKFFLNNIFCLESKKRTSVVID